MLVECFQDVIFCVTLRNAIVIEYIYGLNLERMTGGNIPEELVFRSNVSKIFHSVHVKRSFPDDDGKYDESTRCTKSKTA